MNEEQYHLDLAKKFGLAIGLQDEDFQKATPIFECLAHTSKTIHGMLLGSASENRASALVNETMGVPLLGRAYQCAQKTLRPQ